MENSRETRLDKVYELRSYTLKHTFPSFTLCFLLVSKAFHNMESLRSTLV